MQNLCKTRIKIKILCYHFGHFRRGRSCFDVTVSSIRFLSGHSRSWPFLVKRVIVIIIICKGGWKKRFAWSFLQLRRILLIVYIWSVYTLTCAGCFPFPISNSTRNPVTGRDSFGVRSRELVQRRSENCFKTFISKETEGREWEICDGERAGLGRRVANRWRM